MKTYFLKLIIIAFVGFCLVKQVYPQAPASDSSVKIYHVNYWLTGSIIVIGTAANLIGIPGVMHKPDLTVSEIQGLNKDIFNGFDSWALEQDASQRDDFDKYSDYTNLVIDVLPALLLFDKKIRKEWLDILLMYGEATFITANFFNYSFLGPSFYSRYRPATYYEELSDIERRTGNNRNSFYSGHVASAAITTFFMVKVFSDYNPEIGAYKYLLYTAAAIPPLLVGYFRIKALKHFPSDVMVGLGVGALFGIIIPEFHRISDEDIKLGLYSNSEAIGITLNWQPNILK